MKFPKIEDIILFIDEDIIALNKPSDITSEGDNSAEAQSLSEILKRTYPEAMLVHRLDRETTGIILAARNSDTYRYLSILFEKRKIVKEYRAIIYGAHDYKDREISYPLSRKSFRAIVDHREGKKALTIINTLEAFRDYSFIQALPQTGRYHQIRIHLSSIGSPIIGDELYGGKPFFLSSIKRRFQTGKNSDEQPILSRTALHAFSVKLEHPKGKELYIEAPYKKDFRVALELLEKWNKRD
jgi:23S rRNA pseudouridine955/2504/2580 synthase